MERVCAILLALWMLPHPGEAQVSGLSGLLRYRHRFQDADMRGVYSRASLYGPELQFGVQGYVITPALVTWNAGSSLNLGFQSSRSGSFNSSGKQSHFNYYSAGLTALSNFPVRLSLYARDGETRSEFNRPLLARDETRYRQQQQQVGLASSNIAFLPTLRLNYTRTRSTSLVPFQPFDLTQHEYSVDMSQATERTSLGATASIQENVGLLAPAQSRHTRLQLTGSHLLRPEERVDLTGEYVRYDVSSFASLATNYMSNISDETRALTSLQGSTSASPFVNLRSLRLQQGVQYAASRSLHLSGDISGSVGRERYYDGNTVQTVNTSSWGGGGTVSYQTTTGTPGITNSLSANFAELRQRGYQQTIGGSINNAVQLPAGRFSLTFNHGFTAAKVSGRFARREIGNTLGLNISGRLVERLQSETLIDYVRQHAVADSEQPYHWRNFRIQQRLSGSYYYVIPFNVLAGGSYNRIITTQTSQFYTLTAGISFPYFFTTGLSLSYNYSRSYDPLYRTTVHHHTGDLTYRWRAFFIQINAQHFLADRLRRQVQASIARTL